MKRFTSALLCLLLIASVCSFSSCGKANSTGDITGYSDKVSIIGREIPPFSTDKNGDFKILQFSDTHLICGTTKKDKKTLNAMRAAVNSEKPDIVVISGDMVEGNTTNKNYNKRTALETVGKMFEELNQYWAYVPGNNDGEYLGTSADVAAFLSQYKHCVVADEENLTGATQYSIDIKNSDGQSVHSLVFMDSLQRDEKNNYDYMKQDQVQWLKTTLEAKAEQKLTVSLFFHMNTPDFTNAATLGTAYSDKYNPIDSQLKNSIPGNSAVDDVIKASAVVGLVSIGHIHPDTDECSFYDGRYYHINRASGYYATKTPGCSVITIHTDSQDIKNMYDFKEIVF